MSRIRRVVRLVGTEDAESVCYVLERIIAALYGR
jgi:hypothetical protein